VYPLGLNVLSAYNICKGDYRQAIMNATESYDIAANWNKRGDMANASSILYYAYKYMGDMTNALAAYENYIQLTNDLSSEERQIQVQYNQVELDTRLKEEQLKAAEVQNGLYFRTILITTFLLLLLTALFISYYLSYRKKRSAYRELVLKSQQWAEVQTENLIIQEEENEADEDVVEENELPESYDLELLQRIEKLMREEKAYVDSELTIDLVAKKLHENRYYVSHAINKCLLKNFNTYVNEYRIKEAIRLMSDAQAEKLSINEIAYDSGFNDRKNFYRVFKKNTGLSPSVFRNNLQQAN
jgi:AraC-like DNA-binding protein